MKDIAIIGAGPVGLYAGTIAGLRGLSGYIFEASSSVGGQPNELYAQKNVADFPGVPILTAGELVDKLYDQFKHSATGIELLLNSQATTLKKLDGGFEISSNGKTYKVKTVLIAAGNGSSVPRTLNIPGESSSNIYYNVKDIADFYNKHVVIFGGGDSAVDWANMLEGKANVTLVHRRNEFRANAGAVEHLKTHANVHTPFSAVDISGNNILIENTETQEKINIPFDAIIVQYGQITGWGEMSNWGCNMANNKFTVDRWQKTSVDGIWAVGNACTYDGKITVITSGLGEVTSAIASIATYINPKASPVFFSSTNAKAG